MNPLYKSYRNKLSNLIIASKKKHYTNYFHTHAKNIKNIWKDFFIKVSIIHAYNKRLAARQTYSLPSVRTNYGKLNLTFLGVKIWNTISDDKKECQNILTRNQLSQPSKLQVMLFCLYSLSIYFNPLSQEGGGGRVIATSLLDFPLVPFLLRLLFGQFTHPLSRYPCIYEKFSKTFAVKNVEGRGLQQSLPRPEREEVAAKINKFS